jgi:hypothetical protein
MPMPSLEEATEEEEEAVGYGHGVGVGADEEEETEAEDILSVNAAISRDQGKAVGAGVKKGRSATVSSRGVRDRDSLMLYKGMDASQYQYRYQTEEEEEIALQKRLDEIINTPEPTPAKKTIASKKTLMETPRDRMQVPLGGSMDPRSALFGKFFFVFIQVYLLLFISSLVLTLIYR